MDVTRRQFLAMGLALPAAYLLACSGDDDDAPSRAATPACDEEPTADNTPGPFYLEGSPERASLLEPGVDGDRLVISGSVLTAACRPVAGAVLDFWQADAQGVYDNEGYRLRGRQRTDADGRYRLETIVPAEYPGRTRHIHVKVGPDALPDLLTTQLYFPDEAGNDTDLFFKRELLLDLRGDTEPREAAFDFVLNVT